MSIKYSVRYLQNGPDSEGFDPNIDYTFEMVFDTKEEAVDWVKKYVSEDMKSNDFDISIISSDGIRKEAHIAKCFYEEEGNPDSLNWKVLNSYLGFAFEGGEGYA